MALDGDIFKFQNSTPFEISEWTHNTVREAVLELLREISQSKLSKLCQISQSLLSSIVNNKFEGKIGKKKCEEFGKWYTDYRRGHPSQKLISLERLFSAQKTVCGVSSEPKRRDNRSEEKSEEEKGTELDTSLTQTTSQSCETRLTFHSGLEVPQLRQWFRTNPKPSDRLLLKYAEILNQSSLRLESYVKIIEELVEK
ncbi:unnamed protein product [Medioppia subpectinata]|uniref:CUTL domain-containing protein n=1 Tax=Medioppia subpectinata TaxID=1979941 RepID=A0A7R9L5K1_9ACAR|nr:unnamed protein product [Medioppia subpectinata]CAG2115760.1 unnamed protein product [Medioppia subpectinata]